MVIDTSALMVILLGEPEDEVFGRLITGSEQARISAANYVEFGFLALTRRTLSLATVEAQVSHWGVEVVPVSREHAGLAIDAFARYGKGRHPAALNYGDCFAYALAKESGEPLLFKGDDFAQTDVEAAI